MGPPVASRPAPTPPPGLEQARARTYFDVAASMLQSRPGIDAVSIYDATGRPIAWAGRPSSLPNERINGPAALFVAPGSFGLRLVHVRPIKETEHETQRLGSVAAEYLLTRDNVGRAGPQRDCALSTSLVPVFRQCGVGANTPTGSHAAPLSVGSCPAAPTNGVVAYFGAHGTASLQLTAVPGNLATVANEADIALQQGNPQAAVAAFKQVAEDEKMAAPYRELALIRQTTVEFDRLPPAEVVRRLQPLRASS